ncbi:MAG: mannitol dehydrogenase family protein [Rhizobiaceae bacterium]
MDELIALSEAALTRLPSSIRTPRYDRSGLTPGIVHIGVGNFHRAHQAWYLHRLFEQGVDKDWAIIGAGVRAHDGVQREKLAAQDNLYTLISLDPLGRSAEVVGSIIDFVEIAPDNGPLIAAMADPRIRIVSLTITEGGYFRDPATGCFDTAHPEIVHDARNPDRPRTAFGAIVAALRLRRDTGAGPFSGLCCDNLQGNGAILRQCVTELARLSDPELADWIDAKCTFPDTMVDCIVPSTGPRELELARDFGVCDVVPVTHEPFRQWVIEDDFCAGRPDWDKAGATFTQSVHGFEAMKIRLLNAGHQVLANPGELLSISTIADCMAHQYLRAHFEAVLADEIAPHVQAVEGMAPARYLQLITSRFSNPEIRDTTRRVAFDGSSRHAGFVLPVIREALAVDGPIERLALVEALWARMCFGRREDGTEIEPNDPFWPSLVTAAQEARERPLAWLEQSQYYGDLAHHPRFAEAFSRWLRLIWHEGTAATLRLSAGDLRP